MPYSSPTPVAPLRSPQSPDRPVRPSSPPASAVLSHHDSGSDSDLSDSFIVIDQHVLGNHEEDTESTSTIGTALLAELSDTSSEARYPGSLDGSFHGELGELSEVDEADDDASEYGGEPRRKEGEESEEGLGGSYADAEATASFMTDSRSTFSSPRVAIARARALAHAQSQTESHPSQQKRSLIQPDLNGDNSNSQFRFIFPTPEASFTSSTGTLTDTTPSGSLGNLLPVHPLMREEVRKGNQRRFASLDASTGVIGELAAAGGEREKSSAKGRGVDEGWLRDARIWAPVLSSNLETLDMLASVGDAEVYQLLSSDGSIQESGAVFQSNTKKEENPNDFSADGMLEGRRKEKTLSRLEVRREQFRRAVVALTAAGLGGGTKRWGLIAFASCAFALLSAFGPSIYPAERSIVPLALNITSTTLMPSAAPSSLKFGLLSNPDIELRSGPSVPPPGLSTTAPSSTGCVSASIATQLIPDIRLVRDAISTFASSSKWKQQAQDIDSPTDIGNADSRLPPPPIPEESLGTFGWRRRKQLVAPTLSGCVPSSSGTVPSNVALTVRSPNGVGTALSVHMEESYKSWMKAMANKVIRPTASDTVDRLDGQHATRPADNDACGCNETSTVVESETHPLVAHISQRAKDYAVSTATAIGYLYAPMLAHLDQELDAILRLAHYVTSHNRTLSAISQAQRGLSTAQAVVTGAYRVVIDRIADEYHRGVSAETGRLARLADLAQSTWSNIVEQVDVARKYLGSEVERNRLKQVVNSAQIRLDALAKSAQAQAEQVGGDGMKTLKQARKGLDRLAKQGMMVKDRLPPLPWIPCSRGLLADSTPRKAGSRRDQNQGDPKRVPFEPHHRPPAKNDCEGLARRVVNTEDNNHYTHRNVGQDTPRRERSSPRRIRRREVGRARRTWRKMMDAAHHGAVQVVLG